MEWFFKWHKWILEDSNDDWQVRRSIEDTRVYINQLIVIGKIETIDNKAFIEDDTREEILERIVYILNNEEWNHTNI